MTVSLGVPRVHAPVDPSDRPAVPGLVDRYGRAATDLRVSLTDRCNLRCGYCMPPEGFDWLPTEQILTDDEVIRLVTIAVERLGVHEIRFTGGEPLLRKGLECIVAATSRLRLADGSAPETSLTSNALGLDRRARGLAEAGLSRVNVSLDSLDRATYATMARRDRLPDVLAGIAAAHAAGLRPVKLNAVIMRGQNEADAPRLLSYALAHGYELRFIEQMPLGPKGEWERAGMVTAEEILGLLTEHFDLTPAAEARGGSPAERWSVAPGALPVVAPGDLTFGTPDGPQRGTPLPGGTVGVIASVTRPFCGACDRTRLTADGQMRDCLFARGETDLRGPLRAGASDEELADIWRGAMWGKRAGHGIDDPGFLQPDRPMSAIGG